MELVNKLINDFKDMVYNGKSKSSALDALCANNANLNSNFIRSAIRGADGWYY